LEGNKILNQNGVMKLHKNFNSILFGLAIFSLIIVAGCDTTNNNSNDQIDPPEAYEFTRNGESSVAFPGQNDRLDMVEEMKAYIEQGNSGQVLSEQDLIDMFENTNGNGGGNFSFTSDRQLRDKTFAPDLDENLFTDIFARAAEASINARNGVRASSGTAGLIERENKGSDILVDEDGREFTQLIEKGLMGGVFFNQIFNVYLTDNRIGPGVENSELREGENYTDKEHHFDEAYGYWNAPRDFTSPWPESREDEDRFWSHYSNVVDNVANGELATNAIIQNAFILGRTAIVNDDQSALNEQVDILYENLELVAAATSVHYINNTLSELGNGNQGEAFHALSEAWAFVNALKYSPRRAITIDEINQILNADFGENGNFWNVTPQGLNNAKSTLVNIYPALEPVQNDL